MDSLSAIAIHIDRASLLAALADTGAVPLPAGGARLAERAALLETAVTRMGAATAMAVEAFTSGDIGRARAAIRNMGAVNREVFDSLLRARTVRLAREMGSRALAESLAESDLASVLIDAPPGYDWDRLGSLAAEELAALYRELEESDPGVELSVQAHAVTPGGAAYALHVEGYDREAEGPLREPVKVRFGVPEDARRAFARLETIAAEIGEARSLWQALRAGVTAEFEARGPELEEFGARLAAALDRLSADLDALRAWIESLRPAALPGTLLGELEATEGYRGLVQLAREVDSDLQRLAALARLPESVRGKGAPEALARWLEALAELGRGDGLRALDPETWRERAREARAFLARLPSDAAARLSDRGRRFAEATRRAERALGAVARELVPLPTAALGWIVRAAGLGVAPPASMLPGPAGAMRRRIEEDLDTRVDLRRRPRGVGDRFSVVVRYAFYRRGVRLEGAGWRDLFEVRSFGWSSRVVAGLAFARRGSPGASWEPAPVVTWLLHFRRWPRDAAEAKSTRSWHVAGLGLSALSLDFVAEESIEVGLAATLSLLDDRLMAGYGRNLQSGADSRFWFVSVRVLGFGDPLRPGVR
ncbi:MAG: hypothetical protein D6718_12450 [Acidobacteria bacterium]|nr:MAG: hypothetical protein D6718_12450 [Acidobacteriota bacterium]